MRKGLMGLLKVSSIFAFAIVFFLSMAFYVAPALSQDATSVWVTDENGNIRTEFAPGETVQIRGSGFDIETPIDITITPPSQSPESSSDETDGEGYFVNNYELQEEGNYAITAEDGTHIADIDILTCQDGKCISNGLCGNGVINPGEECDDGNQVSGDSCSYPYCYNTAANPTLPQSCGVDMVLIIDSSGSISNPELTQMKNAFKNFTDAFLPNTPTKIAVVDFDTTVRSVLPYTAVVNDIKNAINAATSGGNTNWEDALEKAHQLWNHRPNNPDLYVFASDGSPNAWGDSGTGVGEGTAVWQAMQDANQIKSDGVRIITLGIGVAGSSANNLKAISSSDAYYNSNFDDLADDLAALADDLCAACGNGIFEQGEECDDGNVCTTDLCVQGFCVNTFNDTIGPVTSNVIVDPYFNNGVFDINATATDLCSNIAQSEYFTGHVGGAGCGTPGTGTPMSALDGSFDSLIEKLKKENANFFADGLNWACVQSKDASSNWGNCQCAWFETDTIPPMCPFNITIDGSGPMPQEFLICGDAPIVAGDVCDDQSGIQGAEYFIDPVIPPIPAPWTGNWMSKLYEYEINGWQCAHLYNETLNTTDLVDGTHILRMRGKDNVENWGKITYCDNVSFIIDTTPPEINKQLIPAGDVSIPCDIQEANGHQITDGCYFVKSGTQIHLTATDPDPQGTDEHAGNVIIHYKVYWSYNGTSWALQQQGQSSVDQPVTITLNEDSYHLIEYWATDGCNWESTHHFELDILDSQSPAITKTIVGPYYGQCPPGEGDTCYIDGVTEIHVEAIDPQPHPTNQVTCDWSYVVTDGPGSGGQNDVIPPFDINFPEESTHVLTITCQDALGNSVTDIETFIVDKTKPVTTKQYGTPFYTNGGYDWITSSTQITLTAVDPLPHPSGVDYIKQRITLLKVSDSECVATCGFTGSGSWNTIDGDHTTFTIGEESCHLIEYYAVDNVNKTESVKKQCVFVENTPPISSSLVDGPQYNDTKNNKLYIDGVTRINLTCSDPQPHPSGVKEIKYRYKVNDGSWGTWTTYTGPIGFPEESMHTLEYYCIDNLNNQETHHAEIYYVDHTPPVTTKTYGAPFYTNGVSEWITSSTPITLTADDGNDNHDSGVAATYYRVSLVDDSYCVSSCGSAQGSGDFSSYTSPFTIGEESCHLIEYYSIDHVQKAESVKKQCTFVDNSAPNSWKVLTGPQVACNVDKQITDCSYVNQDTLVELYCSDPAPHPVDQVTLHYKIEWKLNETDEWQTIKEGTAGDYKGFNYADDSFHRLTWYCVDALGNTESQHEELDIVDSQAPDLTKDIGEPHVLVCNGQIVGDGEPLTTQVRQEGDVYEGTPVQPLTTTPCDSATQPEQCAWLDSTSLPPFAADTITAQGGDIQNPECGNILILSSGDPLDDDSTISTDMGNPGCGLNPDNFNTYDCVQLFNFTPEEDSVVLAVSSEWEEYVGTEFTDWMQIGGIVDVSINDWGTANMIPYGPNNSGTKTLATLSAGSSVDLRVADSGDHIYDTALLVVPLSCFTEPPQPLLCGNGVIDPGEECDDGNTQSGDGCSSLCLIEDGECHDYITQGTEITFTCVDPQPHPVDDVTIEYRYRFKEDFGSEWGSWSEWNEYYGEQTSFNFGEDSIHELEYRCNDSLGNEYESQTEIDIVDTQAPVVSKEVGEPKVSASDVYYKEVTDMDQYDIRDPAWFITQSTPITLSCVDGQPHPVDFVKIYYKYYNDGVLVQNWTEYTRPFTYGEDTYHQLYYYCVDALNNKGETHYELDIVDTNAPVTQKTVGEPKVECANEDCDWWITQKTPISFTCVDDGPHPVDDVTIWYRYSLDGGPFTAWEVYDVPFTFNEDSNHTLEYYCVDALGNEEQTQTEIDVVDTEGPVIVKWVTNEGFVTAEDNVTICANITDIKQTQDPGVGVDEETIYAELELGDDPIQIDLHHTTDNTYCGTWYPKVCGWWHVFVSAEDLLGNYNEENGVDINVDTGPACQKVLNPHAGEWYHDGKIFTIYGWAFDTGGDTYCPASGVDLIEFYALDIGFEQCAQSDIKSTQDFLDCVHALNGTPVFLGDITEDDIEGSAYSGLLEIPEESGLTDVVFLWYVIHDKAGNVKADLAKNWAHHPEEPCEDGTVISMNIDNSPPHVVITDADGLPGPVTSGGWVTIKASVEDYESQPDECHLDLYKYDEGPELLIEGIATANVVNYQCTLSVEIPTSIGGPLESGEYRFEVVAIDEEDNAGSDWIDFVLDNSRPSMAIISPLEGVIYSEMLPVSLHVEDNADGIGIADETVKVKISEIPAIGNLFCIFGDCEETDWITLTPQDNGLYTDTINVLNHGITGLGARYVFDAVACDQFYVPEPDTDLGFSLGNSITDMHCRMISEHGGVTFEDRAQCNDGIDNDADGYIDLSDAGCESAEDDDEVNEAPPEPYCGDGIVNGAEQCDGSDLNGATCSSLGYDGGDLACDSYCNFVTSACYYNAANHIVFSEVFYDTPGTEANEEWLELYNPTDSTVDVSGWKIEDDSGTYIIPDTTAISTGNYLTIARDTTGFNNLYGFDPDLGDFTRGLNNDGDQLTLKDASDIEIDFVAWEGGNGGIAYPTWTVSADGNYSIQRVPVTQDTDTVSDWVGGQTPDPYQPPV